MARAAGCLAVLAALLLFGHCPPAEAGRPEADRLCDRARGAERDAGDFERKSADRRKFVAGAGGAAGSGASQGAAPGSAATNAAAEQSLRAQIAQARSVLPQIRQGMAAAEQDRGVVPGLSQYFLQVEGSITSALQAAEGCLNAPERCSVPPMVCPALPSFPTSGSGGGSAAFVRNVQASYRQAAVQVQQSCTALKAAISRDAERVKSDARASAAGQAAASGSVAASSGGTDLYLVKAGNLRREASQARLEADRAAGVRDYCSVRGQAAVAPPAHAGSAGKGGGREGKAGQGVPYDAKVADLKADWDSKYSRSATLSASEVPLPERPAGGGGETAFGKARDYLGEKAPWWWNQAQTAYRKGDEQMELTEFIKSRPVELVKDVVTEYVEKYVPYGKTLTTGYKILSVTKATADEVGGILVEAPQVIAYGSAEEANRLYDRSNRVPLKVLNGLFDDVVGKFPSPRYDALPGSGVPQ